MAQLHIDLTPELEERLDEYMRLRRLKTEAEAVAQAVREALAQERGRTRGTDFSTWIGLGTRAPQNPTPRFRSDDDLWG